jgi:hypothetical protein
MKKAYEKMVPKLLAELRSIKRNVSSSNFLQELKMAKTPSRMSSRNPDILE